MWLPSILTFSSCANVEYGWGHLSHVYRLLKQRGWAYVQAGHHTSAREYADGADPFKLPKRLRRLALARLGYEFD